MQVSVKGSMKALGSVPEGLQKGFQAWLEGKYAPGKNVLFAQGKYPHLVDPKKGGYSRKQVKVH